MGWSLGFGHSCADCGLHGVVIMLLFGAEGDVAAGCFQRVGISRRILATGSDFSYQVAKQGFLATGSDFSHQVAKYFSYWAV